MKNKSTRAALILAALATSAAAAHPASPAALASPCAVPSFAPGVPLPVPEGSKEVVLVGIADVNGDAAPDFAVAATADGTILVFRNDGRGGFPAVESIPVGTTSFAATLADVDGDGRADLVAFRSLPPEPPSPRSPTVWLSQGKRFQPPVTTGSVLTTVGGPPLVADVDGDGLGDIVALAAAAIPAQGPVFSWSWLRNVGAGLFATPKPIPAAPGSSVHAAADMDGDGRVDLIASKASPAPAYALDDLSILSGDGTGGFVPGPLFGSGAYVKSVAVADLDRNGKPDLVVSRSFHLNDFVETLLADGSGGFGRSFASLSGFVQSPPAVGDVDRDGTLDLVVPIWRESKDLWVFLGDGHGGFPRKVSVESWPQGVALADFDLDGAPDILRVPEALILRNNCGAAQATKALLVPVVASLPGANGARYRTRLTLTNRSATTAVVEVSFTPAEGTGGSGSTTVPGEGQTSVEVDSLLLSFGIPLPDHDILGSLRLVATSLARPEDFTAEAWVSVTQPGDAEPSSGVSFPAISGADAFDGAALLGGLREDGRDRTNLGLVHAGGPDEPDVVLRVTLFPGDPAAGAPVVLPDVRLAAGRVTQIDRVLPRAGLSSSHAFARVERVSGTSRFFAYAVVNDEGTSDGSFLAAVPAGAGRGERRLVVPSVVEAGAYSTDLFLANASASPKEVRLEWVANGLATPNGSAVLSLVLPPARQLLLDDFVGHLRASGISGIPPRGANLAGALFVSVKGGDVEGLLVGSRVTTPAAGAPGRDGVFLPAARDEDLASDPVFLPVSQLACLARTNLAIVNAGEPGAGSASFRVDVWDGEARERLLTRDALLVPERGFLQLSPLAPPCAPNSRELVVTVTRTSGTAPFLAYAVVNDGARQGEGTGDGAVIGMRHVPPP